MTIDPHFLAILNASQSICDIADTLPDTEIINKLRDIANIQFDILITLTENKHFGSNQLDEFIMDCSQIIKNIKEMNKTLKE